MAQGCRIALEEAKAALAANPDLERVVFTPFGVEALELYRQAL
jgi:hypothetical protein